MNSLPEASFASLAVRVRSKDFTLRLPAGPNSPRLMALVARQAVPPLWGYTRYSSAPVPTALVLDISSLDFSLCLPRTLSDPGDVLGFFE
jgi:hypothetical protein